MIYRDIAKVQLRTDEGWERRPYKDSVGKLSAGCGRNLDDIGLHDDEIALMLENDLNSAEAAARALFPSFQSLSENRKAVILNMAFNMGMARLGGFTKFRAAVNAGNYLAASSEMLDSVWAKQVGARAQRLAQQMREG